MYVKKNVSEVAVIHRNLANVSVHVLFHYPEYVCARTAKKLLGSRRLVED